MNRSLQYAKSRMRPLNPSNTPCQKHPGSQVRSTYLAKCIFSRPTLPLSIRLFTYDPSLFSLIASSRIRSFGETSRAAFNVPSAHPHARILRSCTRPHAAARPYIHARRGTCLPRLECVRAHILEYEEL